MSGLEVRRVISEPTAAALAYGLHKKQGVEYVVVVDLGECHWVGLELELGDGRQARRQA